VYRKLNRLCDILDGKSQVSHDPNPHGLTICESNEVLDGLKKLYGDSDANEQVRLMTIAPKEWGRQKIEKWCVFYSHVVQYLRIFSKNVTKNFFHLSGLHQSQIKLDDRLFFEKTMKF
jgi:hypothetical protein